MTENEIGKLVVDSAVTVHRELGPGLLETVYEVHIIDDLSTGGIENFKHLKGRTGFRYVLDTVMNRSIMTELLDEQGLFEIIRC